MIAPSALLRNGRHYACEPLRGPQRASISSRGGTRRDVRYGGTQLWFLPWAVLQRGGAARTQLLRGCPVCPRRQVPSTEVLYCLSRCQHGWQPRQGATGNAVGEVTHVALGTERSPKPQPSSLPSLTVRGGWSHPVFWCPASRLHVSTMSRGEDLHLGQGKSCSIVLAGWRKGWGGTWTTAGRVPVVGTSLWAHRFALEASVAPHTGTSGIFLLFSGKGQALQNLSVAKRCLQTPTVSAGTGFLPHDTEARSSLGKMKYSSYSLPDPKQSQGDTMMGTCTSPAPGGLLTPPRSFLERMERALPFEQVSVSS